MHRAEPHFREAGTGPGVVCLHSNASTSGQWRGLMDQLAPKFHVLAPDSYGAGKSPAWPTEKPVRLRDEAALLEAVFARAADPFALIGHSYGAAVALIAALAQPHRVRALALYEPTLFSLVDAESAPPNDADGIRAAVAGAGAALDAGNAADASRIPAFHRLLDGSRRLGSHARAAQGTHSEFDPQCPRVGERIVRRVHASRSFRRAEHPGSLHGGKKLPGILDGGGETSGERTAKG